jgi:hypothetical protein
MNIGFLSISNLWPLFILVPGLLFESSFFASRRDPGVLVPGGILTTIGLLFLFETFTGWRFSEYTWPVYPLSVAIGLFQLYLYTGRNPALLIPVFILGGVSSIAFLSMVLSAVLGALPSWFSFGLIVPVCLIVLGIYIMLRKR